MGVFDSALGAGAALCKCPGQWALHQKLIRENQGHKEQYCGCGAEQQRSDLLKDLFHACIRFTRAGMVFPSQVSPLLMGLATIYHWIGATTFGATTFQNSSYATRSGKGLGTPFCIRDKPPSQRCGALCGRVL